MTLFCSPLKWCKNTSARTFATHTLIFFLFHIFICGNVEFNNIRHGAVFPALWTSFLSSFNPFCDAICMEDVATLSR